MKKLLVLLLVIFTLTGCFCSAEKEEIRKGKEKARKEMIDYLTKYYNISEVYDVESLKSNNDYSCPSFRGFVSAKFNFGDKEYSILYTNGIIQDELTYEKKLKPLLNEYVDNYLNKYGIKKVSNVIVKTSLITILDKPLFNASKEVNSIEDIFEEKIESIVIEYDSSYRFVKDNINYYKELFNEFKTKLIKDNDSIVDLYVDTLINGNYNERLRIYDNNYSYKSLTHEELGDYYAYWIDNEFSNSSDDKFSEKGNFKIKLVDGDKFIGKADFPNKMADNGAYKGYKLYGNKLLVATDIREDSNEKLSRIYVGTNKKNCIVISADDLTVPYYGESFERRGQYPFSG